MKQGLLGIKLVHHWPILLPVNFAKSSFFFLMFSSSYIIFERHFNCNLNQIANLHR